MQQLEGQFYNLKMGTKTIFEYNNKDMAYQLSLTTKPIDNEDLIAYILWSSPYEWVPYVQP